MTKQEQAPVLAPNPAPAGKSEQPKNAPRLEETLVELTDADLQAVTGGGGRGGIGGEVDK